MLKLCGQILFAFALLSCGALRAQQDDSAILFLYIERNSTGVRLIDSFTRPGTLKPQLDRGSLEFEVQNAAREIIHQGATADPQFERLEFPDPGSPNKLRTILDQTDRAEFMLRIPASGARTIRFFERPFPSANLAARADRQFISEIQIPAQRPQLRTFPANASLSMILSNGPPAVRINIVFLAEGYTVDQQTAFTNQAKLVLNQMLNVSPYKEYKNHFNAFAIFVASAQSGSDHPARGTYRDTYFNSSYGTGALERLITIPPNNWNSNFADGRGKVFALLSEFVPGYDLPVLLVNDTEYGGSGGVPAIASANQLSGELALHEIGHSFAGLADEYEDDLSGYPDVEAANTTRETRREFIKWRSWIAPETPVPTPKTALYQNTVGLFEGAYFHSSGWYRPRLDCRMRNLSRPFCEVCRETHVLTFYRLVELIPSSSPIENNITVPGGGELELRVETIELAQGALNYSWTIDGVTNASFSSNTFPASSATLGTGTRLLRVNVWDPTPLVRNDPFGYLSQSRSWIVQVVAPTNVPPTISEIADVRIELPGQTSATIPFTISDADTPWNSISINLTSSETNLLVSENILVEGTASERTLVIHPEPGAFGETTISIRVSDGTTEVQETFQLRVTDLETDLVLAPIPDQRAFTGPFEIELSITRTSTNDLFFFASSTNSHLLPEASIAFANEDSRWKAVLTPTAGISGETLVSITVTDGVEVERTEFKMIFLPMPTVQAEPPRITAAGVLLRFTSDVPVASILEFSTDLKFWTVITSAPMPTEFEHVAETGSHPAGFYRLRLVPL